MTYEKLYSSFKIQISNISKRNDLIKSMFIGRFTSVQYLSIFSDIDIVQNHTSDFSCRPWKDSQWANHKETGQQVLSYA